MTGRQRSRGPHSIRTQLLVIAWVPSLVLLLAGLSAAALLTYRGIHASSLAATSREAAPGGVAYLRALQSERQLSILYLADRTQAPDRLAAARADVDRGTTPIATGIKNLVADAAHPEQVQAGLTALTGSLKGLAPLRQQVDDRSATVSTTYATYSQVIDIFARTQTQLAQTAPTVAGAFQQLEAYSLADAADSLARSAALATAATAPRGLNDADFQEYTRQTDNYQAKLAVAIPTLSPAQQGRYSQLLASGEWQQLTALDSALRLAPRTTAGLHRVNGGAGFSLTPEIVQAAAAKVTSGLDDMYANQWLSAADLNAATGHRQLVQSLAGAAVLLVIALIALAVSVRLSSGLVRRLRRLREETLQLANERLPSIVERLRAGQRVDIDAEIPPLDSGRDEIGQVAAAFTSAQHIAASAAAAEAETRAGTELVFLNIAHRSQVIAHRQLKVLDRAERSQEDPDQLDLLFQLDHLTTRARRNAENLLILGGDQPGRQWRHPVPLQQIVRSAIGEAETYVRVTAGSVPPVSLEGATVADVIHLLAELVDNATHFSPPTSRVEVRGNLVGKGLVIEVEDQGLGIEPDVRDELNTLLHEPPEFGVMALATEPRVGLFVVARLAAKHGIRVTLSESMAYGGTKAVVLIPSAVIATEADGGPASITADGEGPDGGGPGDGGPGGGPGGGGPGGESPGVPRPGVLAGVRALPPAAVADAPAEAEVPAPAPAMAEAAPAEAAELRPAGATEAPAAAPSGSAPEVRPSLPVRTPRAVPPPPADLDEDPLPRRQMPPDLAHREISNGPISDSRPPLPQRSRRAARTGPIPVISPSTGPATGSLTATPPGALPAPPTGTSGSWTDGGTTPDPDPAAPDAGQAPVRDVPPVRQLPTAEQARDRMAAFARGTRKGRETPDPRP